MDASEMVGSLASMVCPACANPKRPRTSFCPKCYFRLPPDQRNALYQKVGAGYEQAFLDAIAFLKSGQRDVPPSAKAAADEPAKDQGELFSRGPNHFR